MKELLMRFFGVELLGFAKMGETVAAFLVDGTLPAKEHTVYIALNKEKSELAHPKPFLTEFFTVTMQMALQIAEENSLKHIIFEFNLEEILDLDSILVAKARVVYKDEMTFIPNLLPLAAGVVAAIYSKLRNDAVKH